MISDTINTNLVNISTDKIFIKKVQKLIKIRNIKKSIISIFAVEKNFTYPYNSEQFLYTIIGYMN